MFCLPEKGKIAYTGEFKFVAMITLDMIISKETGQVLLRHQFKQEGQDDP